MALNFSTDINRTLGAPIQVTLLTIAERHSAFGRSVMDSLIKEGIRADIDDDNEKIGFKIRKATMLKTPYMCIIGDKETENNTVTIRKRNGEDIGEMTVADLIAFLKNEVSDRR